MGGTAPHLPTERLGSGVMGACNGFDIGGGYEHIESQHEEGVAL